MECGLKEVQFAEYCDKCKYAGLDEFKDPCNDCMGVPAREGTRVPVNFKDKREG